MQYHFGSSHIQVHDADGGVKILTVTDIETKITAVVPMNPDVARTIGLALSGKGIVIAPGPLTPGTEKRNDKIH